MCSSDLQPLNTLYGKVLVETYHLITYLILLSHLWGKASYSVEPAVVRLSAVFCSEKGLITTLNVCILHSCFSMKAKIYFSSFLILLLFLLLYPPDQQTATVLASLPASQQTDGIRWQSIQITVLCTMSSVLDIYQLDMENFKTWSDVSS